MFFVLFGAYTGHNAPRFMCPSGLHTAILKALGAWADSPKRMHWSKEWTDIHLHVPVWEMMRKEELQRVTPVKLPSSSSFPTLQDDVSTKAFVVPVGSHHRTILSTAFEGPQSEFPPSYCVFLLLEKSLRVGSGDTGCVCDPGRKRTVS